MVGLPYDFLANPLGAVRLTFEKAVASVSDAATFDGKDWRAIDLFREFLFDNGGLSQVPILNGASVRSIQPYTLVRFRGMIQDMLGNEFNVGAHKDGAIWRTNKFTDFSQFPMDSLSDTRVWERHLLYCVPVPGQNSWTESSSEFNQCANWASPQREKRQREDDAAMDNMDIQVSDQEFQGSPHTKKMVPHLHCLIHRKLAVHEFLSNSPTTEPKSNLMKEIREALLGHLTAVLGNDGLAAHFMLLHLLSRVVEDDLVTARQADRSLGSQDLSRWLTMGRLMSVSFGETCLSLAHWQMVKELERLRRDRLQ